MTLPKRHTLFPLGYRTLVQKVFSSGKSAKLVCANPTEAAHIRRSFYTWRKALYTYVQANRFPNLAEERASRDTLEYADRIALRVDKDKCTIHFVIREEMADAKLLERIVYE